MSKNIKKTDIVEGLRRKGLKLTKERLSIFEEVLRMKDHFSADDLSDHVRGRNKQISRATIYRTIPLLVEFGVLREVIFGAKHRNYECVIGKDHHEHMICIGCGRIIEFKDDRLEAPLEEISKKYHFQAIAHKTEITGYCRECQK